MARRQIMQIYKKDGKEYKEGDRVSFINEITKIKYEGVIVSKEEIIEAHRNKKTDLVGDGISGPYIKCDDGKYTYAGLSCRIIDSESSVISISAPKNNDGRENCFWCLIPTQKRGNGAYDICPKCGR
jgi:hypothetical protein